MLTFRRAEPAAGAGVVARRSGFEIGATLEVGRLGGGSGDHTGGCCQCGEKGDGEFHGCTSSVIGPCQLGFKLGFEEGKGVEDEQGVG